MDESKYTTILNQELVKSLGCTEPIVFSYATAVARKYANKGMVTRVEINASPNLIKNAMAVNLPGTSPFEINLSSPLMAAALGIINPETNKNLEILDHISKSQIENAKEMISEGIISLGIAQSKSKLYLEVILETNDSQVKVVVADSHTNVVLVEVDGHIIRKKSPSHNMEKKEYLDIEGIWNFVETVDPCKLDIIHKSIEINKKICNEGLKKSYGLQVGINIKGNRDKGFFSDDIISQAIALTAAGSDARMSGCSLPAMSNSGSGNQGISSTIPVVIVGEKLDLPSEMLIKAVTLSNLITIYIKSHFGLLSPMCGAIISATGASCGITYLLGGKKSEIRSALQIMLANLTGMICDGAKSGCALKIATCTYSAIQSALLAINGVKIPTKEGIMGETAEKTIENFCNLANNSMVPVDDQILEIMLQKT
jgi:L-cysteine desulfidase